jgi:antitoxin HigA-1
MKPYRLSMNKVALDLRMPVTRIADIVGERRGISPDTALRLGRYFETTPRFWLNLQTKYKLEVAEDENLAKIERDVRPIEVPARRRKISLLTMLDAGAPAAALGYGVGRIGRLSNASG